MDLTGLEFLWTLITDCAREDIADLAIDYFLQVSKSEIDGVAYRTILTFFLND